MSNEEEKQKVIVFLKDHFVMSIATVGEGKPASSVVVYVMDNDFNFYFVTHVGSRKEKNLSATPSISLSVWEHKKMLVQVDGDAVEVTDEAMKVWVQSEFASTVTKHADFWPPLLQITGAGYTIFKITPTWIRSLDLSQETLSHPNTPFVEITL